MEDRDPAEEHRARAPGEQLHQYLGQPSERTVVRRPCHRGSGTFALPGLRFEGGDDRTVGAIAWKATRAP
jgi:hypothetical protein